jgi:hypothetical protein
VRILNKSTHFGILAGLAVLGVLVASASAAPAPFESMGVVLQADNANLSGSPVVIGATIFSGDTLTTQGAGELRARFGSSQIYLVPNSDVAVSQTLKGFSANLSDGSVLLSSSAGDSFQVLADGAIIEPKTNGRSVAEISWVSPTELLLSSRQGDLQVTMGDETETVSEGSSFRMMIVPASQPGSSPAEPVVFAGHNRFYFVAIVLIAVGTMIGVIRAFESTPATN